MHTSYDPQKIEKKWQDNWEKSKLFEVKEDKSKEKYYVLEMFPYPSGKLHMGHVRNYTIGDLIARYKRMRGFNVLHPMGWDAFGLPAEKAAMNNKTHPAKWTYSNIDTMKKQMQKMGLSYDWSREIKTCSKKYYKWEQWLFIQMFKKDLAYKKESFVNWCESCQTTLAREQVEGGCCWRCSNPVEQKKIDQWFFRSTEYTEDILAYLDKLSGWPQEVLKMQQDWIGKSTGCEIDFQIENKKEFIKIFTTRPDTIFGTTFMALAPEHPLALELIAGTKIEKDAKNFIDKLIKKDRSQRSLETGEKEGLFIQQYCINPLNKEKVPIYIANFAIMDYGTGAIMGVPAHDQRDFEFAQKYNIKIVPVIKSKDEDIDDSCIKKAYTQDGILYNSAQFDNLENRKAIEAITNYCSENKIGKKTINFRLKDWGISRQRYWGAPIPIVYCPKCGTTPVNEEDLPIILPEDANLLEDGKSPLPFLEDFVNTTCPICGGDAKRETDTMDTFVESSWYFLRYCSPDYDKGIFDKESVKYWGPVDQYIGGIEHAILHLLYSRIFTRILKDFDLVDFKEPFSNFLAQGMVKKETYQCEKDGYIFPDEVIEKDGKHFCKLCNSNVEVGDVIKMSKSKKNVIDPEDMLQRFGADTTRLFSLFAAPPKKSLEWNEKGIEGANRFLNKIWSLTYNSYEKIKDIKAYTGKLEDLKSPNAKALYRKTNQTIKKVTDDIEKRFNFNTAISSMMELLNTTTDIFDKIKDEEEKGVLKFCIESVIIMLSVFTPHICSEIWQMLGKNKDILNEGWVSFSSDALKEDTITLVLQVNGKIRAKVDVPIDLSKEDAEKIALDSDNIKKMISGKNIRKIIVVPNKLVNIVC